PAEFNDVFRVDCVDFARARFGGEQRKNTRATSNVHGDVAGFDSSGDCFAVGRKAQGISHHLSKFIERVHFSLDERQLKFGDSSTAKAKLLRSSRRGRQFSKLGAAELIA